MKNLIIGQSGGPTAVINASLCGADRSSGSARTRTATSTG